MFKLALMALVVTLSGGDARAAAATENFVLYKIAQNNATNTAVKSVNGQSGGAVTLTAADVGALEEEQDTLQTVAERGDFAGSETITPLCVAASRFGVGAASGETADNYMSVGHGAGAGANGGYWSAFGNGAGSAASGDYWTALGLNAAANAAGDYFTAVGTEAGSSAAGSYWLAFGHLSGNQAGGENWIAIGTEAGSGTYGVGSTSIGQNSGTWAAWTNCVALGNWSGFQATGLNRVFIDAFSAQPGQSAETCALFIDDGVVHLGRSGAHDPETRDSLRGSWHAEDLEVDTIAVANAPQWIEFSDVSGSITLTNRNERPVLLSGFGEAAVTFEALRPPLPVYIVARGFTQLTFPGAYVIGSGSIQPDMSNHLIVWRYGTNTLINLITATED